MNIRDKIAWFNKRQFERRLMNLDISHGHAMMFLRALAANDGTRWKMRALAEHAVATATTDAERTNSEAWARALRRGGRIKVSTFPILAVSTDPDISAVTALEIENALSKVNLND